MGAEAGVQASFAAALALAALLGLRHGFDADHIAAVDGLTRARQLQCSYWASRRVGLQFAAGHSAVILLAALVLTWQRSALPAWLDPLGTAISVLLLLLIAGSNLGHALAPRAGAAAARPGPMAALLLRVARGRQLHPVWVGVAFALSLDALAQAAWFAAHGPRGDALSPWAGAASVAAMALAFGAGMMVADGLNGALLAWFAQRGDRIARHASRVSSGFIALVALATVGAVAVREANDRFARQWEDAGVWVGVGLLAFTVVFYALQARWRAGQRQPA